MEEFLANLVVRFSQALASPFEFRAARKDAMRGEAAEREGPGSRRTRIAKD